jgi:digeranylgeranylglycerophospholipid reductase
MTRPGYADRRTMDKDCVVGASFAGLACAIASLGVAKAEAGEKLHTSGIIVKEAIDQIAILDHLPAEFVRRGNGIKLYAPNLRHVDLAASGYYFLTTDTPELMRCSPVGPRKQECGFAIGRGSGK